jgi:hypothetical protein
VCWKPCSPCWSFHLIREEFLSAPIHSPLSGSPYRSFREPVDVLTGVGGRRRRAESGRNLDRWQCWRPARYSAVWGAPGNLRQREASAGARLDLVELRAASTLSGRAQTRRKASGRRALFRRRAAWRCGHGTRAAAVG